MVDVVCDGGRIVPNPDGTLNSREICDGAVLERALADESVSSLKIQANLQSDNFVTGTSGWEINRDTGSVEFQDATIRGTLNADDINAGTFSAARIGAGTIGVEVIKLSNSSSSRIESNDGSSLIIRGNGTLVATSATITGAITATSGSLSGLNVTGNITTTGSGVIRTAASGTRTELNTSGLEFYDSGGTKRGDIEASGALLTITAASMQLVASSELLLSDFSIVNDASSNPVMDLRSTLGGGLFTVAKTGTDTADVTVGAGNLDVDAGDITIGVGDLNLDNGDITLDGDLFLQDAGVTEWTLKANTSDDFELQDDDGTARMQITQAGAVTFRNDAGTDQLIISNQRINMDATSDQDYVVRIPTKTTTGNPSGTFGDGDLNFNSADGTNGILKIYAGGAWRTVASV